MPNKLAVKRLTASDLTFFEWHFRNRNAGNQKAINLNADVFVDRLYPALPAVAVERKGRLLIELFLHGPGEHAPLNLRRKIIKNEGYKNWRLDGEFIVNPVDAPERFNVLDAGDIAVIEFRGDLLPTSARVFLLAAGAPVDASLHSALSQFLGERSMAVIDPGQVAELVRDSGAVDTHPMQALALEPTVEDAVLGSSRAAEAISQRSIRAISPEDFREAKRNAENSGRLGEELVCSYLRGEQAAGRIRAFTWVSKENAVAPYDFEVVDTEGSTHYVEVKSTAYDFGRAIHVSARELRTMAAGSYSIYRVFRLTPASATLRIATETAGFAKGILAAIGTLPTGVDIDSFSFAPTSLAFGDAQEVLLGEEDG